MSDFKLNYSFQLWHILIPAGILYLLIGVLVGRWARKGLLEWGIRDDGQPDMVGFSSIFIWPATLSIYGIAKTCVFLHWLITHNNDPLPKEQEISTEKEEKPSNSDPKITTNPHFKDISLWEGTMDEFIIENRDLLEWAATTFLDEIKIADKRCNKHLQFYWWGSTGSYEEAQLPREIFDLLVEEDDFKADVSASSPYKKWRTVRKAEKALSDACLKLAKSWKK